MSRRSRRRSAGVCERPPARWMHIWKMARVQSANEANFICVKGSENAWQNVISRSGRYENDAQAKTKS